MAFKHAAALALLGFVLAGCAGSVTKPVVVDALAMPQQRLTVTDVMASAAPGVDMGNDDLVRMTNAIKGKLTAANLMVPADGVPVALTITFTAYDPGNAGARALMMGLGQIHIDGDVTFLDAARKPMGQYKLSKQFAMGGLIGAATTIKDVEAGFEASVVDMVKDPSGAKPDAPQSKPKLRPL
jgi:hypothetical protein